MAQNSPLSNTECLLQELDDPLALDPSTTSRQPPLQDKYTDLSAQVGKHTAQGAKGRSKKGGNCNSAKPPKAKAVHSSQNVEETLSVKAPENTNTLLQQLMGTMQSFMEENKKEKSELVSTLHSLQTSLLTTFATPRDALSDEHSPSSSEDDDEPSIPRKKRRLSDNSDAVDSVGDAINNLLSTDSLKSDATAKPVSLLQEIANEFNCDESSGPDIDKDLATILNGSMTKPLHDEKLKSLMDQYPLPNNCESLAVPKVTPEVWAKMTPPTRSKDIKLQKVEKFLSKAMISLGILTEEIVKEKGNEHPKEDNPKENHSTSMAKITLDAIRFIGQAQQELHHLRRIEIKPDLNPEYRHLCTSQITATKLLFGDDLAKSIKDLNETNKMTGKLSHGFKGRSKFANKGKLCFWVLYSIQGT